MFGTFNVYCKINNIMKYSNICHELNENILKNFVSPVFYGTIGDLFLEKTQKFLMEIQNGIITNTYYNNSGGFSIRRLEKKEDYFKFFSSTDLNLSKIIDFTKKLNISNNNYNSLPINGKTYINNHEENLHLKEYVSFLKIINEYIQIKDCVENVNIVISYSDTEREIFNYKNDFINNHKRLYALRINLTLKKDNKIENYYQSMSNENGWEDIKNNWKEFVDKLWKKCYTQFFAITPPSGNFPIILGPGEPGVLIHEAVGHGLESDLVNTHNSCFTPKMFHKSIANSKVNVIDDGTINGFRGSIQVDDEGNKSKKNHLVKKGIFTQQMTSEYYKNKFNLESSSNGRRQAFNYSPIPRMTNTYLDNGNDSVNNMFKSIKYGIYAKDFSGGQVETTSGKFVFKCREAYLIENGEITSPLKETMLLGSATNVMNNIEAVGNDLEFCGGSGNCGKSNQMVPVCVGCPHFKLSSITVGGE
ncbi:hypothetical protein AB836_01985 [Rickettsiales bacterium (ex Bugula neritina AB1)]|nr:hypothetical protein AB836_01985 [Rickettsiales bacterium (ex Bugula neritina AB1)]